MHAAPRRSLVSWPAALLPAALLAALLGGAFGGAAGSGGAVGASSGQPPVTELQVAAAR